MATNLAASKKTKIKHFLALGAIATASMASLFSTSAQAHDVNPYANNPHIDSITAQQLQAFDEAFPDFKITFSATGDALPTINLKNSNNPDDMYSLPGLADFNPQAHDNSIEKAVAQELVGEDTMPTKASLVDEKGVKLPSSVLAEEEKTYNDNMLAYKTIVNKTKAIVNEATLEMKETLALDYAQGFLNKDNMPLGVHVSIVKDFNRANPLTETDNYNFDTKIVTISETYHEDMANYTASENPNNVANGHFEGELYAMTQKAELNTPEMEKLTENHEISHDIIHHQVGGFIQIADTDLHLTAPEKQALLLDSKFRDTIDENTADTEGSNITLRTHHFDNETISTTKNLKQLREDGAHLVRSGSIYDIDAHNSAYSLENVLSNLDIIKNNSDPERLKQIAVENSTQGAIEGFQHYSKEHNYSLVNELNTKYKSNLGMYVYNAVNQNNPGFVPLDLKQENISAHDNEIMQAYANSMKDDAYVQKFFNIQNKINVPELEKAINNITPSDTSANIKEFTTRYSYMKLYNNDNDTSETHTKSIESNEKYWSAHYTQLKKELVKDSPVAQPKQVFGVIVNESGTLDESRVTPSNINDYSVKNAIYNNIQHRMDNTALGTVKLTEDKITQAIEKNKIEAKAFPMNIGEGLSAAATQNGVQVDPTETPGELADSISSLAIAKIKANRENSTNQSNFQDNSDTKTMSLKDRIASNRAKLGLPSLDNTNTQRNTHSY